METLHNRHGEEIQEVQGVINTDPNDEDVPIPHAAPPQPERRRPIYTRRTRRAADLHDLQYDGYEWIRYQQKEIPNARHPRYYDRCSHRFTLGCQATRWVQKVETNIPPLYRVTYIGKHTCDETFKTRKRIERLSLFMTFVTECLSAAFEQLDMPLGGMVMGIIGFFICIAEICYKVRVEQASVKWRGKLPMLYSHYPIDKVFGSFIEWFIWLATIYQCFHACLGYYYHANKNAENPIKMAITMVLLAICLAIDRIVAWYLRRIYHAS